MKAPTLTSPTSVLICVSHAALNPGSSVVMQLCPFIFRASPAIPELDFSGTITSIGSDVPSARNLKPGTPVFGSVPISAHTRSSSGALAEYVVVPADHVIPKPVNASFEEVAGLPVAGSTALAVVENAGLKRGDSVLVNGASGGIGSMVIQMTRAAVGEDGTVVAICSGKNFEMVKRLGADEVIDYTEHETVTQYLTTNHSNARFDNIIDAYGVQELYDHCPAYLKEGGIFSTVGVAFKEYGFSSVLYSSLLILKNLYWPRVLGGVPRDYVCAAGITTLESMKKLEKLMEKGKLRVVIDSTWDMEDVQQAYEKMFTRRAAGKIVIRVQEC